MSAALELLALFGRRLEGQEHPCAYLDELEARDELWLAPRLDPEIYHELMDLGFRRSGPIVYRPRCEGCRLCVPLRVPVETFRPTKSQRRTLRRNPDVALDVGLPIPTPEKYALFRRWKEAQHAFDSEDDDDERSFRDLLYSSPVDTREIVYREEASGKILGVSLVDVCARSCSSVFHYFDPDEKRRGLGTLSALMEIELCRRLGIPHYYLGYWIAGARSMDYKTRFGPYEILDQGRWSPPA